MPEDPNNPGLPESEHPTSTGGQGGEPPSVGRPDPSHSDEPPSSEDPLIAAARMAAEARSDGHPPEPDLPPPDYFPGYVVTREIHRGGQGVVYQAVHKGTKRKVAIKLMREAAVAGKRERTRFEREVEILAQLDHPNIVAVHDSGLAEGNFYYVMDYISGATLDVWISQKDLSIDEILGLFAKICDAVNAAHLKGVIHRDIKPANVRVDANGQPHLVDFGLARVATGELSDDDRLMTMTGQFIGSLPWASPEQAQGIPGMIDVRTDVYSLGVVLYQMLTGRFPYQVVGAMRDVLDNILRSEPARPSTVRRQINDEIETIVLKCLSKERERRYQNAGDVARDIAHYLRGEPIEAKRDSGWYVLRKTARRYRGVTLTASLFLLLLVAFAISMSVLYGQKSRALAERDAESGSRAEIILELRRWLEDVDPYEGQGRDVTMRAVADRAAERLDERAFAGQPLTEADLRSVLGRTFFALAEWAKAEHQLAAALPVHESMRGPTHEETIFTRHLLGVTLQRQGRFDEALPLLQRAADDAERVLGLSHPRTVMILNDLGQFYKWRATTYAESIPALRRALAAAQGGPGVDARTLAIVRGNLGEALGVVATSALAQATGALREAEQAGDAADAAAARDRVAQLDAEIDEAESLLDQSVAGLTGDRGADHPDVAAAQTRLGSLYVKTGRTADALARYLLALEIFRRTLDPLDDNLVATRFLVGSLREREGDLAAAIDDYAAIVSDLDEAAALDSTRTSPNLAAYRYRLGRALLADGRATEARPVLERAAEELRGKRFHTEALQSLLECCRAQGDAARAAEVEALLSPPGGG